ncbi:hypothetical protein UO65_4965 [Actinokineospora spheciospongiae]|uniref:Uncharacterized protein n=1 Tax=Actinokineospora spheciospongiae TaxID=909613 RepID=W7ITK5_9PSEU|nr:hypothetical protein [Actinokineospora spheciospongiae]EWC59726.1 hypothetical protein UO65_4965 [Actinokineospora spheciospongiae]PWW64746.1 hypothetical protein DFQ13_103720 [Actinokineospora spheciospongiae]
MATFGPRLAGVVWGEQHDRLLNFVFRAFDCCVRDRDLACAMTVDLFGRNPHLVDSPDLDDDAIRAELVPLMAAALRERSSHTAIKVAVGHAAWQDRVARSRGAGAAGWHSAFGSVRTFTRHLRLT